MEDTRWTEEDFKKDLEMEVIERIAAPILERLFEIEEQIGKPLVGQNIRIEILDSPQNDQHLITRLSTQADYSEKELQTIESILTDDFFLKKLETYIKDQIVRSHRPVILH